ncbi:hypothetical protein PN36_19305 [Candidatus Thiomargarita nelsonii]|uniref:CHAT domain-containing protein n=1 Tax=Candidatus Thiomargarita nelsonii TaxID=1003181 RepID=A0A0A6PL50_9GAMM|nr:hypothetical protein PN36_19305 [Candidatus Thiomargarita nelsonii]
MIEQKTDFQFVLPALEALINADMDDEVMRVLQQHPELLSQQTILLLDHLIDDAHADNAENEAQVFKEYRDLLKLAQQTLKKEGIHLFDPAVEAVNEAVDDYIQKGNIQSLESALAISERILLHPDFATVDIDRRLQILNDIGITYLRHYQATGTQSRLNKAVKYLRNVILQTPVETSDLASRLNNLGNCLCQLYNNTSNLNDITEAIKLLQQAIQQTSPDSSDLPMYLDNLGIAFNHRYARIGDISDLQQAVQTCQQAVMKTPNNSPELSNYCNNLANTLCNYYDRIEDIKYLQEALKYYQKAVQQTSTDSPNLMMYINNLANGFFAIYNHTKALADLEQAITYSRKVVRQTSESSPDLAMFLNGLGISLCKHYEDSGDFKSLEDGIKALRRSTDKLLDNSPYSPLFYNNLGNALSNLYKHTGKGLQEVIKVYRKASETGLDIAIEISLGSARNWLIWAFTRQAWQEVEQAYNYAYKASEKLLKIQLLRDHKETWLKETQGIAAKAAYAFAKNHQLQQAVVALESGLARLLSEALARDRADLEQLKTIGYADLYDRYQQIIKQWHFLSQQSEPNSEKLRATSDELDATISAIQQIQGFDQFLKPPTFATIQQAAQDRTLVYIIATEAGGLALQVWDEITPIWLQELTQNPLQEKLQSYFGDYADSLKASANVKAAENALVKAVIEALEALEKGQKLENPKLEKAFVNLKKSANAKAAYDALKALEEENAISSKLEKAMANWQQAIEEKKKAQAKWEQNLTDITYWLWQTVMSPIIDALPKNATITLIPAGLLGLLPLHAAWTHDDTRKTGKRYALDELIIRYAPNARALKEAHALAQQVNADKLLAIENPSKDLPYSVPEVNSIQATFTSPDVLSQENATQEAVLNALPDYNVLHFSCHGYTNFEKPLQSGLLMANGQEITLEELLKKHLKVRLATLSVCETGLSGTTLPDEVVSLSSGMLQAGVAGVVASLWSVSEINTMMLMTRFYGLWQQKQLDPVDALQQAQQWVRDTTKEEKLAYFRKAAKLSPDSSEVHLPKETANWLYYAIKGSTQYFSHPYHWAAFTYVGV